MVKRFLLFIFFIIFYTTGRAQCPQIYDGLGTATTNAQFVNCISGDYTINFQFVSSFSGAYTIVWGDGSPNGTGTSYTAGTTIPHTYSNTIGTFTITYSIPSAGCTHTALVVMERPISASIQIPIGGVTQACAPRTMSFTNSSTNVSSTTTFTWDFGDGTPLQTFNSSNAGQTVTHNYLKNTVNCQTQVMLKALNYCRFNNPSIANYNPIQIYDVDNAAITPDKAIRCFPDNLFTFNNTTARNCVPEGNTFQRQEKWILGNYWGFGHDSVVGWRPWPPTSPLAVAFPAAVGNYTVMLLDSNLCGITSQVLSVSIVNAPVAGLIAPSGNLCQNVTLTFTNTSSPGYTYKWNFGEGAGFQSLGSGSKQHSYASPGVYTVQVVASLGSGGGACSDTARVPVNILASPVANFSFTPAAGCSSLTNVMFTDLSAGASTYTWTFNNGNISHFQLPPPQSYTTTGVYTASLVVTGTTSCVNTKTASIVVRPDPVANFPVISPCVGATGTFSSTSTVTGANPITSYTWSFGDGSSNSNSLSPTHTYTAPATYSVKLVVATAFCSDSVTKNVVVNIKPTASFVITPTIACPPYAATFTNVSSNAAGYLWQFGTSPTATSTATTGNYTYQNSTQGFLDYTVTLIASTSLGCADTVSQPIRIKPKPIPIFSMGTSGGCSPLITTFTNNTIGATDYYWEFGDGTTSTTMTPVFTFTNISVLLLTNTVTLVATNSVNCSDSVKHTLQIFPQPLTTFTMNPASGCTPLFVNFPSVPGIVSYTWNFGDGTTPITASTPTTHIFTNTTSANITLTVELKATNAFGCIDSSFKYPVIFPKPIPDFVMTPTAGCSPLSISMNNISSLASSYLWRFGDGTPTVSVTNPSRTYSNTTNNSDQTYTCTLIATTVNGCKDSIKKNVLVYYMPQASFTQNDPQCAGTTFSFTNSSSGTTTPVWNFGDSSPTVSATNPSHTYTNNTINNLNYTVQLLVTTANSCTNATSGYPVVYAHPIANYALSNAIGCSPLSNTMTNVSLYAHNYLWSYGDGTVTSTSTNTAYTYTNISHTADQSYTCTLTAYNNNGCSDIIKKTVTVYYKPLASLLSSTPGCTSTTFNFTNTSTGVSTPVWTFGDNSPTISVNNPAHTYTNNTLNNMNYTVQLVVATPNSCRDTAYCHPVVYSIPEAHFAMTPTAGCSPLPVSMTNNSSRAHTYLWKFGDGATTTNTTASHTYTDISNTTDHTFTCTLIAFNNNGCKDSLKENVMVYYKPDAIFSQTNPKCTSQIITFSNTSVGAAVSSWTFGDGSPASGSVSPVHAYTNTTINNITYTAQLVVTSPSLCTDTAYGYPEIYAMPIASFAITPTLGCSPLLVNLSNSSSAAHTYQWKFGDGLTSTVQATVHTYTNTSSNSDQTYTATLVAYNNNGCRDSTNLPLYVYFRPKSVLTLDTPACTPKVISFTNTSKGAVSYNWIFGDGATATTSNTSHQYINTTPFNQTFNVQLVSTSANNCKDTLTVPMIVHPKPHFFISSMPDSGCSPLTVFFPQLSGVTSYVWLYNDDVGFGNTGNIHNTFVNDNNTTKTFNVKLIARDIYSCPDTPTTVIRVFPRPKAKFSANPLSVYVPNQLTYMTNLSSGASTYSWSFGDGGNANDFEPSHLYSTPGEYQIVLMAGNDAGCVDTFNLDQPVVALGESTVAVPNAFTPLPGGSPGTHYSIDTDRNNSIFHPNIRGAQKYELSVYSRWGELLFATKDPDEGWDGYYKGQLCTPDVYIWKVVATFVDGKVYKKTGDLLLLR